MSTRIVWICAIALAAVGVTLYAVGDERGLMTLLGLLLITLPIGLAVNLTARRRRAARREDSPDSVEHRAAHAARSDAFEGSLVLVAAAMLGIAVAPGPQPMLWGVLTLVAMVGLFWARYTVHLRRLGG